jgi:hypothetical protein
MRSIPEARSSSGTKGVRLARGEYVWIKESDDYADARFLERLVGVLQAEPEVTFAYCRSWRVREGEPDALADDYLDRFDSNHRKADFVADGLEECRKHFIGVNPVPNASSVVFRKMRDGRAKPEAERL